MGCVTHHLYPCFGKREGEKKGMFAMVASARFLPYFLFLPSRAESQVPIITFAFFSHSTRPRENRSVNRSVVSRPYGGGARGMRVRGALRRR